MYENYDPWGYDKKATKGDWIFGSIFAALLLIVVWSVLWLVAGFKGETACTNYQKVTEVQLGGGRQSYSFYYIRGESGGVTETRDTIQVGEYICFNKATRNYYQLSPWLTWWKG
jgi:hypothetical protein